MKAYDGCQWFGAALLLSMSMSGAMGCSSDGDTADSDRVLKSGSVFVSNTHDGAGEANVPDYVATAGFLDATKASASGQDCTLTKEGACFLSACTGGIPSGDYVVTPPKRVHAGGIEIRGGQIEPVILLNPSAAGDYESAKGAKSIWSGGEEILIRAAGNPDGVPDFSGTLQAPTNVTILAPLGADPKVGPTIVRTNDLEIRWTARGAASGRVEARISLAADDISYGLACRFPVADEKGTIPSAMLGKLPAGSPVFALNTIATKVVNASDWRLTLMLLSAAGRDGGGRASGGAVLE